MTDGVGEEGVLEWGKRGFWSGDAHMGGVRALKDFFSFCFFFFGDLIGLLRSCAEVPRPGWLAT